LNRNRVSITGILVFLFSFGHLISAPVPAGAQQDEVAILQRGPIYTKGLPFFLPNAIPAFYGVYRFRGAEVTVYYTENPILRRKEWSLFPCADNEGLVVPEGQGALLLFPAAENEWTVFFSYYPEREDICAFIDTSFDSFRYFRGITRDRSIPPFPAVLSFD
jgi:hypothetical protein